MKGPATVRNVLIAFCLTTAVAIAYLLASGRCQVVSKSSPSCESVPCIPGDAPVSVPVCESPWRAFTNKDAILNLGRSPLLRKQLARAAAGEEVVLVVTGGSISMGHGASAPQLGWSEQVAAWWNATFPKSKYYSRALSGTGTFFSALCAHDYVANAKPDILMVEFSVNDYDLMFNLPMKVKGAMLDNFLLPLMYGDKEVAVVFVFPDARDNKATAEDWHSLFARHYGTAYVSRKAHEKSLSFFPLIGAKAFDDVWHPNDFGYTILADLVVRLLERGLAQSDCLDAREPRPCILSSPKMLAASTACYSVLNTINPTNIEMKENNGFVPFDIEYNNYIRPDQRMFNWDKKQTLRAEKDGSVLKASITGVDTAYVTAYIYFADRASVVVAEILDAPCTPVVIGADPAAPDTFKKAFPDVYFYHANPPLIYDERGYSLVLLSQDCVLEPDKTYMMKFTALKAPVQFIAVQGTRAGKPPTLKRQLEFCPDNHPNATFWRSKARNTEDRDNH